MVSALLTYGQGRATLADLHRLIDEPVRDSWTTNFQMVPPHGLYLVDVMYRPEEIAEAENAAGAGDIRQLQEEHDQLLHQLRGFDGNVLEKINLKERLLKTKKLLAKS